VLEAVPPGDGVTGLLSKLIETPTGAPENDRDTGALKLLIESTVIDTCPEPPCITLKELGDALRLKVSRSCPFTEE